MKSNYIKSMLDIEDIIMAVLVNKIDNGIEGKEFNIIISSHTKLKHYFSFDFKELTKPIIYKSEKETFYIYNDFYDFKDDRDNIVDIKKHFDSYNHFTLKLPNNNGSIRIDYKSIN